MTSDRDRDTDALIPRTRRVPCEYCGTTVDKNAPGVFQYVAGWAKNRSAGGGNAVALPERAHRWACPVCIDKLRHGMAIGQTTLF